MQQIVLFIITLHMTYNFLFFKTSVLAIIFDLKEYEDKKEKLQLL